MDRSGDTCRIDTLFNVVNFSPDSTRFVTGSGDGAAIWDVATTRKETLYHEGWVDAAKYSSQGDRIATATEESVRVWNSNDGRLLADISVKLTLKINTDLLWLNNHILVLSDGKIKEFDASTGSIVSELPVADTSNSWRIALPRHGEFIACCKGNTVSFWDTSTHYPRGLIHHTQAISSIAFSPDDQFLAIGGDHGKITIKILKDVFPSYHALPFIDVTIAVFDSWQRDQLADSDASLSEILSNYLYKNHLTLANRTLSSLLSHTLMLIMNPPHKPIKICPSVIGYIAKSLALIGGGGKREGCQVFDLAFRHCDRTDVDLLLLIKAVVLFMAGEHIEAVSRVGNLIATVDSKSICDTGYVVQAYMYLRLGNSCMEKGDYEGAIQSFERGQSQMRYYAGDELSTITLISGWKFDGLDIRIRQRFCEALYAAGRTKDAVESLLNLVNALDEEVYMSQPMTQWVSDFTHRSLSASESNATRHGNPPTLQVPFNSVTSTSLLREWAKATLASQSWKDALVAAVNFVTPRFATYQAVCECLQTVDPITHLTEFYHQMVNELSLEADIHSEQAKWARDFRQRCVEKLEHLGDAATDAQQLDEAITQYTAAVSLDSAVTSILIKRSKLYAAKGLWEDALNDTTNVVVRDPLSPWGYDVVLNEWAKVKLRGGSWRNALVTAAGFNAPRFTVYRALCEHLKAIDQIADATECLHEMESQLAQQTDIERALWNNDFKSRCIGELEVLGDLAMNAREHVEAISWYSVALSLGPTNRQVLFIKRSKARANEGLWKDALNDANEVIKLNSSSPLGYERKHAALRGAGCNNDAMDAFDTMLSKMSESPDPEIRERSRRYVNPAQTEATIRGAIENTIRESPLVLINTDSGRLLDKSGQSSSFESQPIFHELVSSMITDIDRARIEHEVEQYYRYATFSHKWKEHEPLFETVIHIVVYDLDESLTHDKLKMFCKIVREAGLHWAWSDTCCINKVDPSVLQEALVSMFQWYQASTMTLILLCDVGSASRRGDLMGSIWNTRAWTFQEYHASKVVRFYNKDWTLYRNIGVPNHKESSEIISEMEQATGVSAQTLMALRPGLEDIREKLRLASTRQTTRVEDAAYSLLGIFSLSLPVVYGEGNNALGRLLAQLLSSSGDTSILAWSGKSGNFNSCLPAKIAVFDRLPTSHIPPAIADTEMTTITSGLRASSLNLALVTKLYDRLNELRVPSFLGKRMILPCIVFKLGPLSVSRSKSERIFRAQTAALGIVEIRAEVDLARLDSLYLIHPWIDFLLDRQPVGSIIETIPEEDTDNQSSLIGELPSFSHTSGIASAASQTRTGRLASRFGLSFGRTVTRPRDATSLEPPSTLAPTDKQMRALQVIARLRQPFGALLLTPNPGNVAAYRRVASESLITVQVEVITPAILNKLVDSVRILDVL
ncbi:hypothetical protein OG21DRAFT_217664 [Imleria badia]|nr:hypothetical protein OG21DRAFT_217664 [Imleria badia]